MALSVGFRIPVSPLRSCYPSYGAPTLTPVGLSPTERASLRWTHNGGCRASNLSRHMADMDRYGELCIEQRLFSFAVAAGIIVLARVARCRDRRAKKPLLYGKYAACAEWPRKGDEEVDARMRSSHTKGDTNEHARVYRGSIALQGGEAISLSC